MQIGIIGAGNMAQAIVKGLLKKHQPSKVIVSAPTDRHLGFFHELGCCITHDNEEVVRACPVIFLCVKPAQYEIALLEVHDWSHKLLVSVVAGLSLEKLNRIMGPVPGLRVVRCVPNTPLLVSKGVCCIAPGPGVPVQDTQLCVQLLQASSLTVKIVPEQSLDAICALSGSGPAFVYMMIEALADGGVKMGLSRDLAMELAANTVEGAAHMVSGTGRHPGELKDAVCSPGGTTIAGIHALEKGAFRATVMDAIQAATDRSIALGNLN